LSKEAGLLRETGTSRFINKKDDFFPELIQGSNLPIGLQRQRFHNDIPQIGTIKSGFVFGIHDLHGQSNRSGDLTFDI
jgi:hypothetical protein